MHHNPIHQDDPGDDLSSTLASINHLLVGIESVLDVIGTKLGESLRYLMYLRELGEIERHTAELAYGGQR